MKVRKAREALLQDCENWDTRFDPSTHFDSACNGGTAIAKFLPQSTSWQEADLRWPLEVTR